MSGAVIREDNLKKAIKEALVEVLEERRGYIRDVIEEVLEDFELVEDVREVKKSERFRRGGVFAIREGEA